MEALFKPKQMKNNYVFTAPMFRSGMERWKSGKWAKLIFATGNEVYFAEGGDKISVDLESGEKVTYKKGWNSKTDTTQTFVADPSSNKFTHTFE